MSSPPSPLHALFVPPPAGSTKGPVDQTRPLDPSEPESTSYRIEHSVSGSESHPFLDLYVELGGSNNLDDIVSVAFDMWSYATRFRGTRLGELDLQRFEVERCGDEDSIFVSFSTPIYAWQWGPLHWVERQNSTPEQIQSAPECKEDEEECDGCAKPVRITEPHHCTGQTANGNQVSNLQHDLLGRHPGMFREWEPTGSFPLCERCATQYPSGFTFAHPGVVS